MTDTTLNLILALFAFVGSHLLMSSSFIRTPLRAKIGKWPFTIVYSIISFVTFYAILQTYGQMDSTDMWDVPTGLKHLSLTLMLLAILFIIHGALTVNPGTFAMEQAGLKNPAKGVHKITRHPVSWGIILWGISHVLANSDLRGLLLFSAMAALSFLGAMNIDRKRQAEFGDSWQNYANTTSFFPFQALFQKHNSLNKSDLSWIKISLSIIIYGSILWAHSMLFGVDVIPVLSGS